MYALLLLLACSTEPRVISSEPTEPTVDLKQEEKSVTWSTLGGLLPEGEPAIPESLGELRLGMAEARAREVFEAARHKKLPPPADREIDGVKLTAGRLDAFPTVGATLMFRDGVLGEFDLSLPRDEALFAANEAWGTPDDRVVEDVTVPQPVWLHDGLRVTLIEVDEEQAILKFARED